jgi:hypothetical protein
VCLGVPTNHSCAQVIVLVDTGRPAGVNFMNQSEVTEKKGQRYILKHSSFV